MKITRMIGREIFDSKGLPTIECEITLDNHIVVRSQVPAGTSCSRFEAKPLYDDEHNFGVLNAIENFETIIVPEFIGHEPNIIDMDLKLLSLDNTSNKSYLGANTILATSIAIAKAHAMHVNLQLYEFIAHLCGLDAVVIPYPMFNVINGGMHAMTNFKIQEIMLVPMGFATCRQAVKATAHVNQVLAQELKLRNQKFCIGLEGGYATNFDDEIEALDLVVSAVEKSGFVMNEHYKIALDVAASQLYNADTKTYIWKNKILETQDMIDHYKSLIARYPIYSIEDGLSEDDWSGWQLMQAQLGSHIQVVGDDIFASSPERIAHGIEDGIANAAIIKPNQIGTVTESLQAALICKKAGLNIIASHRSGETEDLFIVDFAVGTSAGQLKAGGFMHGERVAKYNHLLRIEDVLHANLMDG